MPLSTSTGTPKIALAAWNAMVAFVNQLETNIALKAATTALDVLAAKANTPYFIYWTGAGWSNARPAVGVYAAGRVFFLSTTDSLATTPPDGLDGDPWMKKA